MPTPSFLNNIRYAIEKRLADKWGSTTPVRYPNVVWKQPATEFIDLGVAWGPSQQTSLGTTKREVQHGTVIVRVNVALGNGTKRAMELADAVQAVFRYQQLTKNTTVVNFYESSIGAAVEGPTHFGLNVGFRFQAEDEF